MSREAESILLCEGYHDRAFLDGWLRSRECKSWKDKPYPPNNDNKLGGGQFAFQTPKQRWVRVVPVEGEGNLLRKANVFLQEAKTRPISRIVLVWDVDRPVQGGEESRRQSFERWAIERGAEAASSSDFHLPPDLGDTTLALLLWHLGDPSVAEPTDPALPDLPPQQTLERLVCAAIRDTDPDRCRDVVRWLCTRSSPPKEEKRHKTHVAFHMAGWFSDWGYEGFFKALWDDYPAVRPALEARLSAIGATRVIDAVVG
jgi:hypothetical protein